MFYNNINCNGNSLTCTAHTRQTCEQQHRKYDVRLIKLIKLIKL